MTSGTIVLLAGLLAGFVLSVTMLLTLIEAVVDYGRGGANRSRLLVSGAYIAGCVTGATAAWALFALAGWHLSFWTTMQASVNAAIYTHRVEHMAENILVWTGFTAVASGTVCASVAAIASKRSERIRSA